MMDYLTDSLCSCESSAAFSALAKRVAHLELEVLLIHIGLLAIFWLLWRINRETNKILLKIIDVLDCLNRRL